VTTMTSSAALSEAQLQQFDRDGYLIVRGLLGPEELQPILDEYELVLDGIVEGLVANGSLQDGHATLPFAQRYLRVVAETGQTFAQHFDPALPQSGVTAATPMWMGPAVFGLLTSTRLLDAVESVVGPEITANPVQHVRIKPPESLVSNSADAQAARVRATSWHQDNGVVTEDADDSEILTVWIPLTTATAAHGCLTVVPGSHRGEILTHCPGGDSGLEIPESVLSRDGAVPLPMEPGDILLLHRRTAHASLSNVTDEIRWSLDLRFNPTGQATGRSAHPEFVARSRSNPTSELRDAQAWRRSWEDARALLARETDRIYNRWDSDAPACA
jgi:phytanoyl-CoA hydroxylase